MWASMHEVPLYRSSFARGAEPVDEARQPLAEGGARCVAEFPRGAADVGEGLPDVAGLLGEVPDVGRLAQGVPKGGDHLAQLNGVRVAEIVEVVAGAVVDGADNAVD